MFVYKSLSFHLILSATRNLLMMPRRYKANCRQRFHGLSSEFNRLHLIYEPIVLPKTFAPRAQAKTFTSDVNRRGEEYVAAHDFPRDTLFYARLRLRAPPLSGAAMAYRRAIDGTTYVF